MKSIKRQNKFFFLTFCNNKKIDSFDKMFSNFSSFLVFFGKEEILFLFTEKSLFCIVMKIHIKTECICQWNISNSLWWKYSYSRMKNTWIKLRIIKQKFFFFYLFNYFNSTLCSLNNSSVTLLWWLEDVINVVAGFIQSQWYGVSSKTQETFFLCTIVRW